MSEKTFNALHFQDEERGLYIFNLEAADEALREAQQLGMAFMVVGANGHITVEPRQESVGFDRLREAVDGGLEGVCIQRPVQSGLGPYLAYANSDGLGRLPFNVIAQHLFGVDLCGNLAVEVGFSIGPDGEEVATPIQDSCHL